MKIPTKKEITTEIRTLRQMAPKLPPGTLSDNKEGIAIQIKVLEENVTDEDTLWQAVGEDPENPDRVADLVGSGREAMNWLNGRGPAPSIEWFTLVHGSR
jgi:hypothetical protein